MAAQCFRFRSASSRRVTTSRSRPPIRGTSRKRSWARTHASLLNRGSRPSSTLAPGTLSPISLTRSAPRRSLRVLGLVLALTGTQSLSSKTTLMVRVSLLGLATSGTRPTTVRALTRIDGISPVVMATTRSLPLVRVNRTRPMTGPSCLMAGSKCQPGSQTAPTPTSEPRTIRAKAISLIPLTVCSWKHQYA